MVVTSGVEKIISHRATKRHGYSEGYGTGFFGFVLAGHTNRWAGIYQRYPTRKGVIIRRSAFYWPTNPRTELQQARRLLFASGVAGWQALTTEQKEVYNKRARRRSLTGFNVYMHEYMTS